MTGNKKANALVMQSGGSTPVLNRSLFGIVREALERRAFGAIYGAASGLEGLLADSLVDLGKPSRAEWSRIARTPGAALGSTRRRPTAADIPVILDALAKRGIGYWFIIGGNDSADTGHRVSLASRSTGSELLVINVPKTIDNDLAVTDHSPGYGSAARFVALATMGVGRDAEAMGDAGWLAASSALARRDERDAPHVVCVPEVPVDEARFMERIEDAYRRFGFAVAVVAENARGPAGVLGGQEEPWYVDDFGHPYFDGPGRYLAAQVSRRLGVRVRYEKPGTIQRTMMACVSRVDAREAEEAGRAAVRYALDGHGDQMVTLVRQPGEAYACTTGLVPLERVGGKVKTMPKRYLDRSGYFVTEEFIGYARPLIGPPLPRLGRLR
jgi:6-phosphofructokinase 1